ncbi:hypothetical protein Tco_0338021, partial [Tanacetum coccineum]
MSSPYFIVNRVESMIPLVKPLEVKNFDKSSSYQALGACFNPYRAFLRRSQPNALNQGKKGQNLQKDKIYENQINNKKIPEEIFPG